MTKWSDFEQLVAIDKSGTLKRTLLRNLQISSLGDIRFFLGIEVHRDHSGEFLIGQQKYIADVVRPVGLQNVSGAMPGYGKMDNDEALQYKRVAGQMLCIAVNSKQTSFLSRKISYQTQHDWNDLKRMVQCMMGTADLKLRLSSSGNSSSLVG